MDHADWQTEEMTAELAAELAAHVVKGGRVILRSASTCPHYVDQLQKAGFNMKCVSRIDQTPYMDRVNMYASFWYGVRR